MVRVVLFVDDMDIVNDCDVTGREMLGELMAHIYEKYDFSSSDDDNVYLGMAAECTGPTSIFLTQNEYKKKYVYCIKDDNFKEKTE